MGAGNSTLDPEFAAAKRRAGATGGSEDETAAPYADGRVWRSFVRNQGAAGPAAGPAVGGSVGPGPHGPGFFDGGSEYDALKGIKAYQASFSSRAKDRLIRGFARALKEAGLDLDPEASHEEILRRLRDQLPDPRKGTTFSSEAAAQESVCRQVATVINNEFTPGAGPDGQLIDVSSGGEHTCRAVAEMLYALSAGLQAEFLEVYANVRRALHNLNAMDPLLQEVQARATEILGKSADAEARAEAAPFQEAHKRLALERDRQKLMLEQLLGSLLDDGRKALQEDMDNMGETYFLVKKLRLALGSDNLSNALARALSGFGTAASMAKRVDESLKTLGLSVGEYLGANDFEKLMDQIESRVTDPELIVKIGRARRVLAENFDQRDVLERDLRRVRDGADESGSEALNAKALSEGALGAAEEVQGGYEAARGGAARSRGARAPPSYASLAKRGGRPKKGGSTLLYDDAGDDPDASDLDRRIRLKKLERKEILQEFLRRLEKDYGRFIDAIEELSNRVGRGVPLSSQLNEFRDLLKRLRDLGGAATNLSVLGYYQTPQARQDKENFLGVLRGLELTLTDLLVLPKYSGAQHHLQPALEAIRMFIKTIDTFSDIVQQKYGGAGPDAGGEPDAGAGGADAKEGGADAKEGGAGAADAKEGGASLEEMGLARRTPINRNLNEALNRFLYRFYVAKIRENLSHTGKELSAYQENYERILGDAISGRLASLREDKRSLLKKPIGERGLAAPEAAADEECAEGERGAAGEPAATEKARKAAVAAVEEEFEVKERFYRTLEALDIYLKVFTNAIVNHPDEVRDIKEALDDVQVIGRWYTERAGDSLALFFEQMGMVRRGDGSYSSSTLKDEGSFNAHYYTAFAKDGPGSGIRTVDGTRIREGHGCAAAVLSNFQALKNIINAFARIGEKFGGRRVSQQVFMSPAQIFRNLTDYLRVSSVSVGSRAGCGPMREDSPAAAAYGGRVSTLTRSNYEVEDRFFVFMVKAMTAKVMTVVGMYDLFERPEPLQNLTPTRVIIGGSAATSVEAIPGAAELYFRLPRLAEFYREILEYKGADEKRIALIPDFEGLFDEFIRRIFYSGAAVSGNYADTELDELIADVNAIFVRQQEKHGADAVEETLRAFVAEINRRYGLVKRSEWEKYNRLVQENSRREVDRDEGSRIDYAILPGENEEGARRIAPSDRYAGLAQAGADRSSRPGKHDLDREFGRGSQWGMLCEFRDKIEKIFSGSDVQKRLGRTSYSELIATMRRRMEKTPGVGERLGLAKDLIRGSRALASGEGRHLFMFHETVVFGLNVLASVHGMVSALKTHLAFLNIDKVCEALNAGFEAYDYSEDEEFEETSEKYKTLIGNAARRLADGLGLEDEQAANFLKMVTVKASELGFHPSAFHKDLVGVDSEEFNFTSFILHMAQTKNSAHDDTAAARKQMLRYVVDAETMMAMLVTTLFNLQNSFASNFVEINFPRTSQRQVEVRFTNLATKLEELRGQIKDHIDILRPHIAEEIFDRYVTDRTKPGTFYWLEENLFDAFIRGKKSEGGITQTKPGFDDLSNAVSEAFESLTGKWDYALATRTEGAARKTVNNDKVTAGFHSVERLATPQGIQYGQAFARLIFYDAAVRFNPMNFRSFTMSDFPSLRLADRTEIGARTQHPLGQLMRDPPINALVPPPIANFPLPRWQVQAAPAANTAAAIAAAAAAGTLSRLDNYRSFAEGKNVGSLMMSFNLMLETLLASCYDGGMQKIYSGLVMPIINGPLSKNILPPGNVFPDLTTNEELPPGTDRITVGPRGDPTPESIVFHSLALPLRRFLDKNRAETGFQRLYTTLAEVPSYLKESMRANLPAVARLCGSLLSHCQVLRKLMQNTNVDLTRPGLATYLAFAHAGLNDGDTAPPNEIVNELSAGQSYAYDATNNAYVPHRLPLEFKPGTTLRPLGTDTQNSASARTDFSALIDAISSGAYSVREAVRGVLKELADEPVLFSTGENSLEIIRSQSGEPPFLPPSALASLVGAVERADGVPITAMEGLPRVFGDPSTLLKVYDARLMPRKNQDAHFKILYGLRPLLQRETLDEKNTPTFHSFFQEYNSVAERRSQIPQEKLYRHFNLLADFLNFTADVRSFSGGMSLSGFSFARAPLLRLYGEDEGRLAYSLRKNASLNELLSDMESGPGVLLQKITACLQDGGEIVGNRDLERRLNLVELNISPLNVHALMRSMPLANVYNYAHTFDTVMCNMLGLNAEKIREMDLAEAAEIPNSKQTFAKLLVSPYASVDQKNVYGRETDRNGALAPVQRIFRGNDALGMGRPKFLSDQVFNKSLFGNLHLAGKWHDEAGPGHSATGTRVPHKEVREIVTMNHSAAGAKQALRNILERLLSELQGLNEITKTSMHKYFRKLITDDSFMADTRDSVVSMRMHGHPSAEDVFQYLHGSLLPALHRVSEAASQLNAADHSLIEIGEGWDHNAIKHMWMDGSVPNFDRNEFIRKSKTFMAFKSTANNIGVILARGPDIYFDRDSIGSWSTRKLIENWREYIKGAKAFMRDIKKAATELVLKEIREDHPRAQYDPHTDEFYVIGDSDTFVIDKAGHKATHGPDDRDSVNNVLTFAVHQPDGYDTKVHEVRVGIRKKEALQNIGFGRFNSKLVRNLFFVTNVQRMLREGLNRELSQNLRVLVSSHNLVSPSVTEYDRNIEIGTNEVSKSHNFGSDRFV